MLLMMIALGISLAWLARLVLLLTGRFTEKPTCSHSKWGLINLWNVELTTHGLDDLQTRAASMDFSPRAIFSVLWLFLTPRNKNNCWAIVTPRFKG